MRIFIAATNLKVVIANTLNDCTKVLIDVVGKIRGGSAEFSPAENYALKKQFYPSHCFGAVKTIFKAPYGMSRRVL